MFANWLLQLFLKEKETFVKNTVCPVIRAIFAVE
jgi:hypothetical protein